MLRLNLSTENATTYKIREDMRKTERMIKATNIAASVIAVVAVVGMAIIYHGVMF